MRWSYGLQSAVKKSEERRHTAVYLDSCRNSLTPGTLYATAANAIIDDALARMDAVNPRVLRELADKAIKKIPFSMN